MLIAVLQEGFDFLFEFLAFLDLFVGDFTFFGHLGFFLKKGSVQQGSVKGSDGLQAFLTVVLVFGDITLDLFERIDSQVDFLVFPIELFFGLVEEHFDQSVHIGDKGEFDFFRVHAFQVKDIASVAPEPDVVDAGGFLFEFLKHENIHAVLNQGHDDAHVLKLVALPPNPAFELTDIGGVPFRIAVVNHRAALLQVNTLANRGGADDDFDHAIQEGFLDGFLAGVVNFRGDDFHLIHPGSIVHHSGLVTDFLFEVFLDEGKELLASIHVDNLAADGFIVGFVPFFDRANAIHNIGHLGAFLHEFTVVFRCTVEQVRR